MDQYIDHDRELEMKKQQIAAAAYFFKKTDQYIAFEKVKSKTSQKINSMKLNFNFHKIISSSVPHLPPSLQKSISTENKTKKEFDRIQVFVQLLSCPETSSCLSIDIPNNCISITNPTPSRKFTASNAPKLFPVDSIIHEDRPIMEICSNSLGPVIRSVANGEDACVISFGNVLPSDLNPIIGSDKSPNSIGVMPCAIVWLFNYIQTIRKQEYARFSVRISAAEISGRQENCRDLLSSISNPSVDSQPLSSSSSLFNSLVELRAVNVEKAAYYLDYALTERSKSEEYGLSHMFLTLHLYQYHLQNDSGISGGRSKLHIIDLGCGRLSEDVDSTALSIQGISKVIYALWSHQRHIPNPDSILAQTLKRLNVNSYTMMQTSMIIKLSGKETQYNEALQVVQLASKLCRQKTRLSKLSYSTCSDDNSSSSDSFSIRRMTKFRSQYGNDSKRLDRLNRTLSISSDVDATSSSEVSCDTVIYRGQLPNSPPSCIRGNADGCSQGQIGFSQSESEERKPEPKLTLFQLKRRTGNKTNSNAWPKVAVKKAKEVMKSGQELWVDGPEAFRSNSDCRQLISNKPVTSSILHGKELIESEKLNGLEKNTEKIENKDDSILISGSVAPKNINKNPHFIDIPVNKNEHLSKTKHHMEKITNENALKSMMVTDWLRNQPELNTSGDKYKPPCQHINSKGNKVENDKPIAAAFSSQRIKTSKPQIEPIQIDHKVNFSRIEDWIRTVSIESPKRTASPVDCGVVMTQSLYSPNCSPFHSTETRFNSFSNVPMSPPSAPLNYSQNYCDQNTNSLRGCSVPPASIGSEIENECSRLWFYNPLINDRHLMPFVDIMDDANNNRSSSFNGAPLVSISQMDNIRSSSFQNPQNITKCQIPLQQFELNNIPPSNNLVNYNIPKYSTLPLDSHSPKHNNSKHFQKLKSGDQGEGLKSNEIFNFSSTVDNTLKLCNDVKRGKEIKKKENKKGFGFLNHLIRNKKMKKDLSISRPCKDESNNAVEVNNQITIKSHECHFSDNIDYVKRAGPPLLLTSPYCTITHPKMPATRAGSSGHGSDCSSFKESKSTQASVNFHQENAGYRFLPYGRAGSSGYESVVRDSELSSHNDSASECSAPTNVALQSKTIVNQTPVNNPNKNPQISSMTPVNNKTSTNNEHEKKVETLNYVNESQKVFELIKAEKICMLEMEQEEMKNELINVLKFFNDDIDGSRKYLETHLSDIDGNDDIKSPDNLNATNQTLRSVLNRYQSNLYMITSFIGKPPSDSLYE